MCVAPSAKIIFPFAATRRVSGEGRRLFAMSRHSTVLSAATLEQGGYFRCELSVFNVLHIFASDFKQTLLPTAISRRFGEQTAFYVCVILPLLMRLTLKTILCGLQFKLSTLFNNGKSFLLQSFRRYFAFYLINRFEK